MQSERCSNVHSDRDCHKGAWYGSFCAQRSKHCFVVEPRYCLDSQRKSRDNSQLSLDMYLVISTVSSLAFTVHVPFISNHLKINNSKDAGHLSPLGPPWCKPGRTFTLNHSQLLGPMNPQVSANTVILRRATQQLSPRKVPQVAVEVAGGRHHPATPPPLLADDITLPFR